MTKLITEDQKFILLRLIGEKRQILLNPSARPGEMEKKRIAWTEIVHNLVEQYNFDPILVSDWKYVRDSIWKVMRLTALNRKNKNFPLTEVDQEVFALLSSTKKESDESGDDDEDEESDNFYNFKDNVKINSAETNATIPTSAKKSRRSYEANGSGTPRRYSIRQKSANKPVENPQLQNQVLEAQLELFQKQAEMFKEQSVLFKEQAELFKTETEMFKNQALYWKVKVDAMRLRSKKRKELEDDETDG